MLKDAAINWVRANCSDSKLRADFSRKITDVLQRRVDCWFAVGQALTRGRVPYLIHCFAGELFIFEISKAQAAGLMLAPDAMASSSDPRLAPLRQNPVQPVMSISNFQLDKAVLTAADRITGSFAYELEGKTPTAYCVRLDCSFGLSGDETSWSFPNQPLSVSGQIHFSFDPLRESVWPLAQIHRGPLAVFLWVCAFSHFQRCVVATAHQQHLRHACRYWLTSSRRVPTQAIESIAWRRISNNRVGGPGGPSKIVGVCFSFLLKRLDYPMATFH